MSPHVVAVSVGTPKPMQVYETIVPSSMVREPSDIPVLFDESGAVGHQTAIHSAPVCAFPAENYDFWSKHFSVDRMAWGDCHFGENLMISGVHEESIRPGDRLRFERGTVLEVTGFRSICSKFVFRMGQPESMLRPINEIGWVGFYLRVVKSGFIGAGDRVVVSSPFPNNMPVGEMVRLFQNRHADPADLRRALNNPGLGPQAHELLHKKLAHQEDVARTRMHRWTGWRPFTVAELRSEAERIRSVVLAPSDGAPIAPFCAGQSVSVRLQTPGGTVVRNWSLSAYQPDPDHYRLTVKHLDGGVGSTAFHQLKQGDRLELRPPFGQFVLDRSKSRRIVLISAGIGLTPLVGMLQAHALRGPEAPPVVWLHSARSGATLALHREVNDLLASSPDFRRQLHFTAPSGHDRLGHDYDVAGRITEAAIAALIAGAYRCRLFGRDIELPGRTSTFYICGPAAFETMVRDALIMAGVDPLMINSESFEADHGARGAAAIDRSTVAFDGTGVEVDWSADNDMSLLELAESAGLAPNYGCRMGLCRSCLADLIDGEVVYDPQPKTPVPDGKIVLCCARPGSSRLVIALSDPVTHFSAQLLVKNCQQ